MLDVHGFEHVIEVYSMHVQLVRGVALCRERQHLHLESQLPAAAGSAGSAGSADQYGGPAGASSLDINRTLDSPRHFL